MNIQLPDYGTPEGDERVLDITVDGDLVLLAICSKVETDERVELNVVSHVTVDVFDLVDAVITGHDVSERDEERRKGLLRLRGRGR